MAEPVRLGLIGAGRWGRVHLRTLLSLGDRVRLTHLCTTNPANAELLPYPVSVVPEWRELLQAPCDALIIATPPAYHPEMLEACLAAAKPCLVEKPLCLDVATAQRLHERIRASGVPVLVNHTHLFAPAYGALKRVVAEGGEPVRVLLSEGMGFGPFRTHTAALWDWGPHDVSLCLDLLGESPRGVEALGGPRSPEGDPELVSLRLDFPGGACAWIQTGRLAAKKRRSLTVITNSRLYLLDDLAAEPLTVASVRFPERYTEGVPEPPAYAPLQMRRPLPAFPSEHSGKPGSGPGTIAGTGPGTGMSTMAHVLTYFLDGLSGGDRSRFGAGLALEVTRVLAACEAAIAGR